MQAFIALVALAIIPAAGGYLVSTHRSLRSSVGLRVLGGAGAFVLVAVVDLIACVNLGLISE
jgi:hypothetical protein